MTLDEALRVAIEVLREDRQNYPEMLGDRESFPLGQGNRAAAVLERLRKELPRLDRLRRMTQASIEYGDIKGAANWRSALEEMDIHLGRILVRLAPPSEEWLAAVEAYRAMLAAQEKGKPRHVLTSALALIWEQAKEIERLRREFASLLRSIPESDK